MLLDKELTRKIIQGILSAIKEGVRKCLKGRNKVGDESGSIL